ncbi:hypothetical protein C2E23DRAFT_864125 [Lenzites betulinus]|nr:hypothetical protein C2E23DRAFT_864125 [Lenzites betulinus]
MNPPEIGLDNPQCFTHLPYRGQWMCNICPPPQKGLSLSLAVRHEGHREHIYNVRMRDTTENFALPSFTPAAPELPIPLAAQQLPRSESSLDKPAAQHTSWSMSSGVTLPHPEAAAEVDRHWHAAQVIEPEPLYPAEPSRAPQAPQNAAAVSELPVLPTSPAPPPVHGPAIPDDPLDQIYDNWAGAMAFNRPAPPNEVMYQDARGDVARPPGNDAPIRRSSTYGGRAAAGLRARFGCRGCPQAHE